MWVKEAGTIKASQHRPSVQCVGIAEGMRGMSLLANRALTSLAAELSVEGIELPLPGGEFILVAFNCLQGKGWVHLDEGHTNSV